MMDGITLRKAGAMDAGSVAALHAASWRSAYRGILTDAFLDGTAEADRATLWRERLAIASPDRFTLLAEARGTLVGFACVLVEEDPQWGSLVDNLHADPAYRGRGLGREMMREVASRLAGLAPERPIHLFCLEANATARRFYGLLGGTIAERCEADEPDGGRHPALRYAWPTPAALLAGCG